MRGLPGSAENCLVITGRPLRSKKLPDVSVSYGSAPIAFQDRPDLVKMVRLPEVPHPNQDVVPLMWGFNAGSLMAARVSGAVKELMVFWNISPFFSNCAREEPLHAGGRGGAIPGCLPGGHSLQHIQIFFNCSSWVCRLIAPNSSFYPS